MCWGDGDDEEEGEEENAVVHVAEDISAGAGFLDQQHVKTKDTVGVRLFEECSWLKGIVAYFSMWQLSMTCDKRQDTLTVTDSTAIKTIHKSRSFQAYFVTSPINIGVYMAIRSCTKRIFPEALGVQLLCYMNW